MSTPSKGRSTKKPPAEPAAAKTKAAKSALPTKKAAVDKASLAKGEHVVDDDVAEQAKPEPVAENTDAKPTAKSSSNADPALQKRLEEMTDFQLRAYQMSTARISGDTGHVKSAAAKVTLALIEAEVARRKVSPGRAPSPVRAAVASPKLGKKRD